MVRSRYPFPQNLRHEGKLSAKRSAPIYERFGLIDPRAGELVQGSGSADPLSIVPRAQRSSIECRAIRRRALTCDEVSHRPKEVSRH